MGDYFSNGCREFYRHHLSLCKSFFFSFLLGDGISFVFLPSARNCYVFLLLFNLQLFNWHHVLYQRRYYSYIYKKTLSYKMYVNIHIYKFFFFYIIKYFIFTYIYTETTCKASSNRYNSFE